MRIEVIVGQDEPQIYPLSQPKITVGSSEACEIIITADGVSRKHLQIISEDDNYYVVDQGSTNGTYINEQRLVPGRRTEFTSFFPVRLGDNVLLSLLSDEESEGMDFSELNIPVSQTEAPREEKSESTSVINLKELNKVRTEDLVKKRNEKATHSKTSSSPKKVEPPKKNEMSSFKKTVIIGAIIVGGVAYYEYRHSETPAPVSPLVEKPKKELTRPPEPVILSRLVEESDLTKRESLDSLLSDFKCLSELEKYLCEKIPGAQPDRWGVTQVGTMLNVMVDGTPLREKASLTVFKNPNMNETTAKLYEDAFLLMLAATTIHELVPPDLDFERLKDFNLTFALFEEKDGNRTVYRILAVKGAHLKEVREYLSPELMESIKDRGVVVLDYLKDYVKIYE